MKSTRLIGLVLVAAVLAGCTYYGDRAGVTLSAAKAGVLSGEIVSLEADAWTADGSDITYEWTEDGVLLEGTSASLDYSRFVTAPLTVRVEVSIRTSSGASAFSSKVISVSPPLSPATLVVVNDSPFSAYYLYVSAGGSSSWGPNQMRPSGRIPAGGSFVVQGIPAGVWDVLATGDGGSPIWKNMGMAFIQGETRTLHLY